MNPELSGSEKETAGFVAEELRKMGLTVKEKIAGYGLVAELTGTAAAAPCVALRADMDALPILEQNNFSYRSLNEGKMHACGHDAHMAMVLGAADILAKNPPRGTVKFIFQPSEEKPPGGAKKMVKAGILGNPDVSAVLGLHVSPDYPLGTVALKEGTLMAIADDFVLTIRGKGGHGAYPHLTADTIVITAQVIQNLQHIVSRRIDPTEPAVLSIGTIQGGTAQNIIPDQVILTGTVRTISEETRGKMVALIKETVGSVTTLWGGDFNLDYLYGYPPVVNHSWPTGVIKDIVKQLPEVKLTSMDKPLMIGEDFSYYGRAVPAAYFFLGIGSDSRKHPLHHSCFDIEEDALPLGTEILARSVCRIMDNKCIVDE